MVRLLKRRPRSFDIQVQDMVLRINAPTDFHEESRAAALGFWEQLQAYALRNPEFRTSKRPLEVPENAPDIVREMVRSAAAAGVGPMFTFQGAFTDQVGRFLARSVSELTVSCGGDYFIVTRKRMKLTVHRRPTGGGISVVIEPRPQGLGVSTMLGGTWYGSGSLDGLAVLASSCMLADAASAAVQAILPKAGGFHAALDYLKRIDGVQGGLLVKGDRIGVAGGVEIAA